jgi:PTH1 family peptidyl-tRNA hydrolase
VAVGRFAEEEGIEISKKGFSSLWSKGKIGGREVLFLLPQTFMNRSGEAVREIKDYYRIGDRELTVVHDDLDLPLGRVKLDFDAGAAGHRGVGSMIETLGTKGFYRIRIGIGRPMKKEEVEGYVLSPFGEGEKEIVQEAIKSATQLLKKWIYEED